MQNMRLLVQGLPPHNKNLLIYVIKFLNVVSQKSDLNKMTSTNLATCWSPNLLRAENESVSNLVLDTIYLNSIVETVIENIDYMSVEKKRATDETSPKTKDDGEMILRDKKDRDRLLKRRPTKSGPAQLFSTEEGVVATGWMIKQGGSIKTWKRRWFIFRNLVLFYHRKPQDKVPLGRIPILGYMVEKADNDHVKKPFPFKLEHSAACRTWYFSTSTEEEREFWINTINTAVEELMNSGKLYRENSSDFQLEDDDEDIPEVPMEVENYEQERQLKELEEKLAKEEASLLNEEARMNLEEDDLLQIEAELKQRERELASSNGTSKFPKVFLKSESFIEPPPSYAEVMDQPPAFEDLQVQPVDEAMKLLDEIAKKQ